MRAPVDDFFSLVPDVLMNQAFYTDVALFEAPEGPVYLSFWLRVAHVMAPSGYEVFPYSKDKTLGCELVAYPCDVQGAVFSWERRYEVESPTDGPDALRKLRAMVVNGVARLCNYEGLAAEMMAEYEECRSPFDWNEMPRNLQ